MKLYDELYCNKIWIIRQYKVLKYCHVMRGGKVQK